MRQPNRLISALLRDHTHRHLYHTSPEFKAGVRFMAEHVIPMYLDGLALRAQALDFEKQRFQQMIEMGGPDDAAIESLKQKAREMGLIQEDDDEGV